MKRLIAESIILSIALPLVLLLAACAPAPGMIATLTQLPFAATPKTPTPYPTASPRPTSTRPTPTPASETETPGPVVEAVSSSPTTSATLDATVEAALTMAAMPSKTPAPCSINYDTALPTPDEPANYIGHHYNERSLPAGLFWLGSGMLAPANYSYTHIKWHEQDMYWIQKLNCKDANGTPNWGIVDVLTMPVLNQQAHEVVTDVCFTGNTKESFVIAYGTYNPGQPVSEIRPNIKGWPMTVKEAWQMKNTFVPLNLASITCIVQESQNRQ